MCLDSRFIRKFRNGSNLREPAKTAHCQNGPNEGRKRPTETKTALMEEKTLPKRPQLTSKTAHPHVQNGPLRNMM